MWQYSEKMINFRWTQSLKILRENRPANSNHYGVWLYTKALCVIFFLRGKGSWEVEIMDLYTWGKSSVISLFPSELLSVFFRANYSDSVADFSAKRECTIALKDKILWKPRTSLSSFTTLLLVEILQKRSSDTSPESPYQEKKDDGEL